ncbi:MAG: hypothetical protein CVU98_04240 [Firmicutes bacterium HGW-Firmicutes-3]|jgi:prepilin-type N-terminal cleavage/methylation domain-containing protein|nr:MAG: hypothetical protein CVU98_04240 [Firmicutes bacterium HGW-Firmicutes-3]
MYNWKDNKGLTLIEVVISIAILGIVAIAFLSMFSFGYTHVTNAGHKSDAGFLAHQAAEQEIAGGTIDPSVVVTSIPSTTITINLDTPLASPMERSGTEISFEVDKNGKISKVTTFIPD